MTDKDRIIKLLESSKNGTITTSEVNKSGVHRTVLKEFVDKKIITRYGRGIYVKSDSWEDDFFLLQQKYKRGIYSHDTALYLLGYCDRTPDKYTMTFPKGYNSPSLKRENVEIVRVVLDNYSFGVTEILSPSGNKIKIYDIERTLCDILRGKGSDIQIVNLAMKKYVSSKNKNINKLMKYAEKLNVKPKVLNYMEVLL